jgi:hypothetical protein
VLPLQFIEMLLEADNELHTPGCPAYSPENVPQPEVVPYVCATHVVGMLGAVLTQSTREDPPPKLPQTPVWTVQFAGT